MPPAYLATELLGGAPSAWAPAPVVSRRSVVVAVVRRGGPKVLEASLVPAALFYASITWGSLGLAYAVALAWTYCCLLRRLVGGQPVPGVLVLATVGVTVRTIVALASGSSFVYFAQPIVGTVATGAVFLGSILVGRPLIAKLAHDFWPITPEQADLASVRSLMRGLTMLWAGVNLVTAAVTFVLLSTLPLHAFIAAKQVSGWAITISAIAATVAWAHHVACLEGIISPRRASTTRP